MNERRDSCRKSIVRTSRVFWDKHVIKDRVIQWTQYTRLRWVRGNGVEVWSRDRHRLSVLHARCRWWFPRDAQLFITSTCRRKDPRHLTVTMTTPVRDLFAVKLTCVGRSQNLCSAILAFMIKGQHQGQIMTNFMRITEPTKIHYQL